MMEKKEQFFHIELEHLGTANDQIFPFNIFVFNPNSGEYSAFLFANSPLMKEKYDFLQFICEKGGEIAISMRQKKTFLRHQELDEKEIPYFQEEEIHPDEEQQILKVEKLNKLNETPFLFKENFQQASLADNFLPLIERSRLEIEAFSMRISSTVSLARNLAEELLVEDNFTNRVVAVSYLLAKACDIQDEESLGDLVVAAFLSHIGETQLSRDIIHKSYLDMPKTEQEEYKRHSGLTHHLIKKSGLGLSDRSQLIISEHHERWDGQGYPNNKKGDFIQPLALILGAVAHLFEYSSGSITGERIPLTKVLMLLKEKNPQPGLEFQFGDFVLESLIGLLSHEEVKDLAA